MDDAPSPHVARILACEAAIVRIRAALRAGQQNADQVADDFELVFATVAPIFIRSARSIAWVGPTAAEEALDAMVYRLQIDVMSETFPSLETGFGAYLRTMPVRIIQTLKRKNMVDAVSSPMERLDAPIAEDGMLLHETVSDPDATSDIQALADHEAIQHALDRLPPMQRAAIVLRLQGESNNAVADRLGVSPATATRLCQRAIDQIKVQLRASEE
ncbi:MAG TPA: sigma-70 family RNA polymerase sigma factor [Herpetosiphonaceae bacterium]